MCFVVLQISENIKSFPLTVAVTFFSNGSKFNRFLIVSSAIFKSQEANKTTLQNKKPENRKKYSNLDLMLFYKRISSLAN